MTRRLPPYVTEERDKRGRLYVYFRRPGRPKVRLRDSRSADFMALYARLLAGEAVPSPSATRPTGTLCWLVEQYERSAEVRRLDPRTRRARSQILAACLAEPISPESARTFGQVPASRITGKAIRVLRDRKADKPAAAGHRVKVLRRVFAFGVEFEHVERNPARDIPLPKTSPQGFHSWSVAEVQRYEARHPIGTQARLAFAILLYTGQRRSDVVNFGRQHVSDGWLRFTQHKNRNREPIALEIPIRPELQAIIDASTTGDLTWLVTSFGRPFKSAGFGNKFRTWCDEAGLPHCSAHGLRKAAATRLAEAGATEQQIMSITGHRTSQEVTRYTRAAR